MKAVSEGDRKRFQRELAILPPADIEVYSNLRRKLKTDFINSWKKDPTWGFVKMYKNRTMKRGPQCCAHVHAGTPTNMAGRRRKK
jgi:hypothetical protein